MLRCSRAGAHNADSEEGFSSVSEWEVAIILWEFSYSRKLKLRCIWLLPVCVLCEGQLNCPSNLCNLWNSSNITRFMFLDNGKNKVTCGYGNLHRGTGYYAYLIPEVDITGVVTRMRLKYSDVLCNIFKIIMEYPSRIL
jgi:hypothetical protein